MDTNLQPEIWKVIPNFTSYKISSHGRVFSIRRNKIRALAYHYDNYKNGNRRPRAAMVSLRHDKTYKIHNLTVHSLVAKCFLSKKPDIPFISIDHIDRNAFNNIYTNLRWATPKEQSANSVYTSRRGARRGSSGGKGNIGPNLKRRTNYIVKFTSADIETMYQLTFEKSITDIALIYKVEYKVINYILRYVHPTY